MPGGYRRHAEFPPIAVAPATIPAVDYNCARRALARRDHDEPLWFDLPGLGMLKLVIMPEAWVVADRALGHLPVLAWTGFADGPGRGLHEDVACELQSFAGRAGRVAESIGPVLRRQLRSHLDDGRCEGCEVVSFCRPRRARA